MISNRTGKVPKTEVRRIREPPYVVDQSKLRRFDSNNTVFDRVMWHSSWEGYMRMYDKKVLDIVANRKLGYSRVDFALAYASWIVHDAFEGGFSWKKIKPNRASVDTVGIDWTMTKYEVDDPYKMSIFVKRAARLFGASLVGVCKLNRDWLYADVDVPDEFENSYYSGRRKTQVLY